MTGGPHGANLETEGYGHPKVSDVLNPPTVDK